MDNNLRNWNSAALWNAAAGREETNNFVRGQCHCCCLAVMSQLSCLLFNWPWFFPDTLPGFVDLIGKW